MEHEKIKKLVEKKVLPILSQNRTSFDNSSLDEIVTGFVGFAIKNDRELKMAN